MNVQPNDPVVQLLAHGEWLAQALVLRTLPRRPLTKAQQRQVESNWEAVRRLNPGIFAGPTVRLVSYRVTTEQLEMDVCPSDYKEGVTFGWLGVAMVPVTADGWMALQAPVPAIAATVGGGIRTPGCNLTDADFVGNIISKMAREFNVSVEARQLKVVGLVEVHPPFAKHHYGVVVVVSLKETATELRQQWETAQDKWEGDLLFLKRDEQSVFAATQDERYGESARLILQLLV